MIEDTEDSDINDDGQFVAYRKARTLLGWLQRDDAMHLLLGREPRQEDDLSQIEAMYAQRSQAVAIRSKIKISTSIAKSAANWDLKKRAQDPLLQSAMAGLDWSLQVVDLRRVIAYQKSITIDSLDERILPDQSDHDQVLELCLPSGQTVPPKNLLRDLDHKGFTVSALNPNLRIAGNQIRSVKVKPEEGMQPMPMLAITFLISMGTSYIKVASYNGRDFLRDGYHRAATLLRLGIYEIPCVYIKARSLDDVGGNRETTLRYDILFGDRPPLLSDFWDDTVSAETKQLSIRRAIRVSAEEFDIQG